MNSGTDATKLVIKDIDGLRDYFQPQSPGDYYCRRFPPFVVNCSKKVPLARNQLYSFNNLCTPNNQVTH